MNSVAALSGHLKKRDTQVDIGDTVEEYNRWKASLLLSRFKKKSEEVLEMNAVVLVMMCMTVFALFAYHVQVLVLPKEYDYIVTLLMCFAVAAFTIELMVLSLVKKGKNVVFASMS